MTPLPLRRFKVVAVTGSTASGSHRRDDAQRARSTRVGPDHLRSQHARTSAGGPRHHPGLDVPFVIASGHIDEHRNFRNAPARTIIRTRTISNAFCRRSDANCASAHRRERRRRLPRCRRAKPDCVRWRRVPQVSFFQMRRVRGGGLRFTYQSETRNAAGPGPEALMWPMPSGSHRCCWIRTAAVSPAAVEESARE